MQAAGRALEVPAKESGKQLALLIDLIFTPLQVAKIHRDAWLEDYKNELIINFNRYQTINFKNLHLIL